MRSFRILNRRAGLVGAVSALLLGFVVAPFASAATVTTRSIALSSSTKAATGVSAEVKFTSVAAAGAFVLEFCSNTPLIGEACTAPTGLVVNTATSATSGFTDTSTLTADEPNARVITGTIGATTAITVDLAGITNPTNAGTIYARIVTYDTKAHAQAYTSATGLSDANAIDNGGIALSITDKIGVSAAVLESMTFCVTGAVAPGADCDLTGTSAPTLKLGENTGGVIALDAQHLSTGDIYTQISTNAVGGAIVNLKSNTDGCGGLVRAGAASNAAGCGIAPAGVDSSFTPSSAGTAKFGVKTATAVGVGSNFNGTFQPYSPGGPIYNSTNYNLKYVAGDGSGVTSTYGDPFLETTGPANNMGMTLTFGASIANNTPAGLYSADLSLIATGKF